MLALAAAPPPPLVVRGGGRILAALDAMKNTKIWAEIRSVYYLFVVYPVQEFFLRGWWRSMQFKDICASLTGAPSDFWAAHSAECYDVVYKDFASILAYIHLAMYVFMLLYLVVRCCRRCT